MSTGIKKRILEIIDRYELTPSVFADSIDINRSRMSHILTGRNNPSLEIVQAILNTYKDINADWLLFGQESMMKSEISDSNELPNLFNYHKTIANSDSKAKLTQEQLPDQNLEVNPISKAENISLQDEKSVDENATDKNINKNVQMIIVFYSNGTFEKLIPAK